MQLDILQIKATLIKKPYTFVLGLLKHILDLNYTQISSLQDTLSRTPNFIHKWLFFELFFLAAAPSVAAAKLVALATVC